MGWGLFIVAIGFLIYEKIKEWRTPTIPASYWRNKELMRADKMNPYISPKQVMKNLEEGKYYLSDEEYEKYKQEGHDI